jgi:L-threonylcarbamoyladenylate synthase
MTSETVRHFKKGDVVIFPTDTVYGIGCAISKKDAIKKVYKIRRDVPSKPQLILASSITQAYEYGFFDKSAKKAAEMFWPGPLTIVLKAKPLVPKIIQGGGTVGIRIPSQPPLLKIIEAIGEPILAPSANFHGQSAPYNFAEIDRKLLSLVDYAINLANLSDFLPMLKKPSTVVDLSKKPYKIVRPGYIPEEKIKEALGGA